MQKESLCWVFFDCDKKGCPAHVSTERRCWRISGTHCRKEIQETFLEKIEMCIECEFFKGNVGADSIQEILKAVRDQFTEYRSLVEERDRELEEISLEMALGLSEAFEALKRISSGDPGGENTRVFGTRADKKAQAYGQSDRS